MMETLMSCNSPHPLLLQSSKNNRAFSSSSSSRSPALLSTKKPHQFVSFHHKLDYSNVSSSLQLKPAISSVSCKSSFSESSFESNAGKTEIPSQGKTVRVKIQLIKMCRFGEEILVVGDDRIFGYWDPSGAIPLKWSQGDLWTTELVLPINKSFDIKFILRNQVTGEVIWQPGSSRRFRTLETNNKLVVTGDWNAAGTHMTTEKDPLPKSNTRERIAYPMCSVVKMSHPEDEQNVAGDGVTSTGSFATEKNSAGLRDEDTLLEHKPAEPVPGPQSIALLIVILKEAATEDNNKSEQNQKKGEPGKPDKEQVGVGDEKDCQSTKVDLSQYTDEELERLSRIHFGASFSRDFLEDRGFDPKEFESTSEDEE